MPLQPECMYHHHMTAKADELARYELQLYRCFDHGTMCMQAGQDRCPACGETMQSRSAVTEVMLPPGRIIMARDMHRPGVYLNIRSKADGDGYLEVGEEAHAILPSGPRASGGWPIPTPLKRPEPEPPAPEVEAQPSLAPKPVRRRRSKRSSRGAS